MSSRRARGGGGVFNKLQKRNGGRGDEFTVREGGGTVRSLAGLRFTKARTLGGLTFSSSQVRPGVRDHVRGQRT